MTFTFFSRPRTGVFLLWACLAILSLVACQSDPPPAARTAYDGPVPPSARARLGKGIIQHLTYSPDGARLAVADGVGLTLYAADSLETMWQVPSAAPLTYAAFSPDGALLAAAVADGSLVLIDVESGDLLRSTEGGTVDNQINALSWAATEAGPLLAAGFTNGTLLVTRLAPAGENVEAEIVATLADSGRVTTVDLSPDGRILVSGNLPGQINVWDLAGQTLLTTLDELEPGASIQRVRWSADGRRLLSGGSDGRVIVWDMTTLSPIRTLTARGEIILDVAFVEEQNRIATAAEDGPITLWRDDQSVQLNSAAAFSGGLARVAWAPDGSQYATADWDGTLSVWELEGDEPPAAPARQVIGYPSRGAWVSAAAWDPDGERLAAGRGNRVVIWEPAGSALPIFLFGHQRLISAVAWSPDGRRLASASRDGAVFIWDVAEGTILRRLERHTREAIDLSWSPDGAYLASAGSLDDQLIVWDVAAGEPHQILRSADGGGVWSVAWSPVDDILAAGAVNGAVLLWNVAEWPASEVPDLDLRRNVNWISGLAWSADATRLAASSADARISIFTIATGDSVQLVGHENVVRDVAFSPDESRLVSVGQDDLVIIWREEEGGRYAPSQILTGHTAGVDVVDWGPAGAGIATGSDDGTLIIWDDS